MCTIGWARLEAAVLRLICATVLLLPTFARCEVLAGKAGYLSEWEIKATVAATQGEFSGPMTMTHVGLCTVAGPVEKVGEIHYRLSGVLTSKMNATLTFGGERCEFSAYRSEGYKGVMDCPGTKGVPLTI